MPNTTIPIQDAIRTTLRYARETLAENEEAWIHNALIDNAMKVAKASSYSEVTEAVLTHLCVIHLIYQIDPFNKFGNIQDAWQSLETFGAMCDPNRSENMQIMLFAAEMTVEHCQERLDMAFLFVEDGMQEEEEEDEDNDEKNWEDDDEGGK